MATTRHDLSGAAAGAETATPGSYGEAPPGFRLPTNTRLGAVQLQVADLERSRDFYEGTLGLRVLERTPGRLTLAAHNDQRILVELRERPGAKPTGRPARLGLFHFAILLPDRPALGRFVGHLSLVGVRAGAADHLVSEALYLTDPDGLGIEVYADRPRDTWQRLGRELLIASDPINLNSLLEAAGTEPWTGMPAGTFIGHVHLHVGSLEQGAAFYSNALGFDRMTWRYPGALFLGAGGYHHHLGTNTWAGPTARPPAPDEAQLLAWTIELPDVASVDTAAQSLRTTNHAVEAMADGTLLARDPWGTAVRLLVAPSRLASS